MKWWEICGRSVARDSLSTGRTALQEWANPFGEGKATVMLGLEKRNSQLCWYQDNSQGPECPECGKKKTAGSLRTSAEHQPLSNCCRPLANRRRLAINCRQLGKRQHSVG